MTKVLYIGDNTIKTYDRVKDLADLNSVEMQGLIEDMSVEFESPGYYFTSTIDCIPKTIIDNVHKFDEVRLLDISSEEWSHSKIFLDSYVLIKELERQSNRIGIRVKYYENAESLDYWTNLFKTNKSFCLYPWIQINLERGEETQLYPCSRANRGSIITDLKDLTDWKTDKKFTEFRERIKSGKRLDTVCQTCYRYEDRGLTSYRVHDSLDWIAALNLKSIEDLDSIENPYFYDLRLSNKCNLMCRMCTPIHSHLLYNEFKEHPELNGPGQGIREKYSYTSTDVVKIETLTDKHMVYLTGGEPTIMKEVYEFMRKCIDQGKLDFQFSMTTNAQNLNKTFIDLADKFERLHFSVSIDGYGKVNDYIRWRSNFEKLIENCHMLREHGHVISWNHVPTIWGIHRTHELFEYLGEHFPDVHLYLQYNRVELHSAFNSPLAAQVIESMKRCQQTATYWNNGKDCKSGIDSFLEHYQSYTIDTNHLKRFFAWNDLMDSARNIKLIDYIPDLDQCREILQYD